MDKTQRTHPSAFRPSSSAADVASLFLFSSILTLFSCAWERKYSSGKHAVVHISAISCVLAYHLHLSLDNYNCSETRINKLIIINPVTVFSVATTAGPFIRTGVPDSPAPHDQHSRLTRSSRPAFPIHSILTTSVPDFNRSSCPAFLIHLFPMTSVPDSPVHYDRHF